MRTTILVPLLACLIPIIAYADQGDLKTFASNLAKEVSENNYAEALKLISSAKAEKLVDQKSPDGVVYLAFRGFTLEIPGLCQKKESSLLMKMDRYIVIPGTSDEASSTDEIAFQNSAWDFAFQYNLFALHAEESQSTLKVTDVSLDETREFLKLSKEEWQTLPLVARLRCRFLAEAFENDTRGKSLRKSSPK